MKKISTCAALMASVSLGLLMSGHAHAQLLAYDGFDYAVDTDLYGQGGAVDGWGGDWLSRNEVLGGGSIVTDQAPILADSLGYTNGLNQLVTTGNQVHMFGAPGVSLELARELSSTAGGADGTSIYMSMLIQRVGEAQSPATTSPPNEYPRGANVRWWTDDGERGNIGNNSNAATDTVKLTSKDSDILDSGVSFSGGVNFVVGRIDFDETDGNMLHLWVNPDLATEDLGAAMSTAYDDGGATTHGGIDAISPFLGNDSSSRPPAEILFDELRIGLSYESVTPYTVIPEPASATLAGLMTMALALRRRRRS